MAEHNASLPEMKATTSCRAAWKNFLSPLLDLRLSNSARTAGLRHGTSNMPPDSMYVEMILSPVSFFCLLSVMRSHLFITREAGMREYDSRHDRAMTTSDVDERR